MLINRRKFIQIAGAGGVAGLYNSKESSKGIIAENLTRYGESDMNQILSKEELRKLQKYDAPTISNAIERFKLRPQNEGFMSSEIKCIFPEMPPMVGYAVTAKMRADNPAGKNRDYVARTDWWKFIQTIPEPRVIVIQDLDDPKAVGSFWGEVQGNIHKALGCVGVITDGGVRDLPPVQELGFHFFASAVIVSHAYANLVEIGTPVSVAGLTVKPGELLFGDMHGITQIPEEAAGDLADTAEKVIQSEKPLLDYCKSSDFSLDGLIDFVSRR